MTVPAQRFCTNDGTPLQEGRQFCTTCGAFVPPSPQPVAQPMPEQPIAHAPRPPAAMPAVQQTPALPAPTSVLPALTVAVTPLSLMRRSGAVAVNLIVAAALSVLALLGAAAFHRGIAGDSVTRMAVSSGLVALVVAAVGAATATARTPSVGQWAFGVARVDSRSGGVTPPVLDVARGLLTALLGTAFGFAVWSVLWHPTRRGWQDRLTRTTVVSGRLPGAAPPYVPLAAAVAAAAIGMLVLVVTI